MSEDQQRILVMDDEPMLAKFFKRALSRINCYVDTAPNGESALELFQTSIHQELRYSLVILDINVKEGLGGPETFKAIKELDPEVRILACSGAWNDPIMTDYKEYGYIGALAKPLQIQEMLDSIGGFLAQSKV
ncbi:MAG: response regulator [Verrucomicrobiota bacterium]